jgi:hypothetical protein
MKRYRIEETSVHDSSELDYYGQKRYVIIDNIDDCIFSCEHMSYREAMRDLKDLNTDNVAFKEMEFYRIK